MLEQSFMELGQGWRKVSWKLVNVGAKFLGIDKCFFKISWKSCVFDQSSIETLNAGEKFHGIWLKFSGVPVQVREWSRWISEHGLHEAGGKDERRLFKHGRVCTTCHIKRYLKIIGNFYFQLRYSHCAQDDGPDRVRPVAGREDIVRKEHRNGNTHLIGISIKWKVFYLRP